MVVSDLAIAALLDGAIGADFPVANVTQEEAMTALAALELGSRSAGIIEEERAERARQARADVAQEPNLTRKGIGHALGRLVAGRLRRRILGSGLFCARWYRAKYDIGMDPLGHFLRRGLRSDLAPNPFFDPIWYREVHALRPEDGFPLLHYLDHGAAQALAPSLLFDPVAYLKCYPELALEPDLLGHFIRHGIAEGRQSWCAPAF